MFRRRGSGNADWPVVLRGRTPLGEEVTLRPFTITDERAFHEARRLNADWLGPWDATSPEPGRPPVTFAEMVRSALRDGEAGRAMSFVIEIGGGLVGQLNISNITMGSFRNATAGYWLTEAVAGRAIMPTALALAIDHLMSVRGLHRVEVNIRPENLKSLAVVRKLGLRDEGLRERMLHIDGDWRDHRSFAITAEELAETGLLERLHRSYHASH